MEIHFCSIFKACFIELSNPEVQQMVRIRGHLGLQCGAELDIDSTGAAGWMGWQVRVRPIEHSLNGPKYVGVNPLLNPGS